LFPTYLKSWCGNVTWNRLAAVVAPFSRHFLLNVVI
jgi:hypothetical protein